MKSDKTQLEKRGYVEHGDELKYINPYNDEIIMMLRDSNPCKRTVGARLLINKKYESDQSQFINILLQALAIETKLYTKIEICNTLISYGEPAVEPMIGMLGKVGKNQHKIPPENVFNKDSYPLPRDIIARTISRMHEVALPALLNKLHNDDMQQLSEVIDAIGYICYYNPRKHVFEKLKKCYEENIVHDLIRWKTIRAMSAFSESEPFLNDIINDETLPGIKNEIERSLRLIKKRF